MGQTSFARIATLSFVSVAAAIVASTPTKADDVKMGYINKMGEHPWFVSEVAGAKVEAGKLGVNLMTQDVQFDANLALTTFDTMVGDGVKAIAIVVPDKALGPVVAEKAQKAGIRSVKDNISLAIPDLISRFDFINDGDERRIAGALVDRLRIRTPSLDASVSNLSGGNQQEVVLGRWLARRPKVLILDEPARGVDVGAKAEIYRLIAELAAEEIALLVISSEMPELPGLADRILVMAGGRVVSELPREEASEERILSLAMADNLNSRGNGAMTDLKIESVANAADRPIRRSSLGDLIERVGTHHFSLLIALAALIAIFGFLRPDVFFLLRNVLNIRQAIAILGILATAQTIVIISGGLDISVGAVLGLSTVCIALAVGWTGSPALSILFGVAVGAIAGFVNGLIITVGRINAVIATLGTMAVFRGVAFIISNGQSISIFDPTFRFIGDGKILGVPVTILVLVVVVAIFFVLMRYTITGRNIYAIGGNPVVARLAGLNVRAYQIGH